MGDKSIFALFQQNDYASAINELSKLIKLTPNSSQLYERRAFCYLRLFLYRKSLSDINQAIALSKTQPKESQLLMKDLAEAAWKEGLQIQSDLLLYYELLQCASGENESILTSQYTSLNYSKASTQISSSPNTPNTPKSPTLSSTNSVSSNATSPTITPKSQGNTNNNNSNTKTQPANNSNTKTQPANNNNKNVKTNNNNNNNNSKPNTKEADMNIDLKNSKLSEIMKAFQNPKFDALAKSAIGQMKYGSGKVEIDKYIALGYFYVNSGNLGEGIKVFDALLSLYPKIVAGYLGRGTAFALMGKFVEAVSEFSQAINIDPNCTEALKRRGQTRGALNLNDEALSDFNRAVSIDPDHEAFQQRGMILYRKKNYKRALEDFNQAAKIQHQDPVTWNHMGLCYNSLGDCSSSIDCHKKALAISPEHKDVYSNLGQAYKDWGKYNEAMESFQKAISLDPKSAFAYHLRGLTYFGAGEHLKAIADLKKSLSLKAGTFDCLVIQAVANLALGQFKEANNLFNQCLSSGEVSSDYRHSCWYQRELMLWWCQRLDTPTDQFNPDVMLDAEFKEFYCKRLNPKTLKKYKPQPNISSNFVEIKYSKKPPTEDMAKILKYCLSYGKQLHQKAPGYHSNKRQQSMAGLAVLEIAQRLRDCWFKNKMEESGGHCSSSRDPHTFGYRDLYDICIKWRQVSEPNDPVWWVDLLTKEQFTEGFGSHTPMITGQCNVIRYSTMVPRAFPIFKEEIFKQKTLSSAMKEKVTKAKDVAELYAAMKKDFWVVTPCHSSRKPGSIIEGTRLTLQKTEPEGYEFSIRTPGTPPRWLDYDNEMSFVFEQLTEAIMNQQFDLDKISNLILTLTFYWYNFMPLSRGTAACGFIGMLGMFLAVGIKIDTSVPGGTWSTDWEAILRPRPEDFIGQVSPWMYPARKKINIEEFDNLPRVNKTVHTIRRMIEALNCDESEL